MNTISDITNFIFIGKKMDELSHYDLLIINADWAEEQLANDLKKASFVIISFFVLIGFPFVSFSYTINLIGIFLTPSLHNS